MEVLVFPEAVVPGASELWILSNLRPLLNRLFLSRGLRFHPVLSPLTAATTQGPHTACLSTLCTGQGAWPKTRPRSSLHSTCPAMNPSTRLRPQRRCLLLVSAKGPSGLVGTPPSNKLGLGCPQLVFSTTKSHTQQQAHTTSVLTNIPTSGLQG